MLNKLTGREWSVGDALKFHDSQTDRECTGTIISLVGNHSAMVHWDDGYRDSGVNLTHCEPLS